MNPLVSILVPAYNSQNYLEDTLRSAVGQIWPRKEIIIVDDGSTDQQPRSLADSICPVRLYREKPGSCSRQKQRILP